MSKPAVQIYEFGPFLIDTGDRLLFKEGELVPLAPKVIDILLALVEKSGRVLDKDELMQEIWPDTFVEEGNLARNVSTLRRALGESEEGHQYIETIPRRGYRFVGKVQEVSDETVLVRERSRVTIEQVEVSDSTEIAIPSRQRSKMVAPALLFVLIAGGVIGFFLGEGRVRPSQPVFQRLTFRHGNLSMARIANDGQTIVYSATVEGHPPELFATRLGSPDSRSFGISADLYSISSTGQMAINLFEGRRSVLAQLPLIGGEPRKLVTDVVQADWAPDGKNLAIVRRTESTSRIEYPIGKTIYETPAFLRDMHFSPKGDLIAFAEYQPNGLHELAIVSVKDGIRKSLTSGWRKMHGLAWSANGKEVWVSGVQENPPPALYAVSLSGELRVVARLPGKTGIQDISRDGRVLIELDWPRHSMMFRGSEEISEHDVSWMDGSVARDLSPDGKSILFNETGEAGGNSNAIYMRRTDGSAAIRLGEGRALALSPDGNSVLAYDPQEAAPHSACGQRSESSTWHLHPGPPGRGATSHYAGSGKFRADFTGREKSCSSGQQKTTLHIPNRWWKSCSR